MKIVSGFVIWEMHEGVVTLINFFRCYQLTIVANPLLLTDNFSSQHFAG
jgi:hypothetical protein